MKLAVTCCSVALSSQTCTIVWLSSLDPKWLNTSSQFTGERPCVCHKRENAGNEHQYMQAKAGRPIGQAYIAASLTEGRSQPVGTE